LKNDRHSFDTFKLAAGCLSFIVLSFSLDRLELVLQDWTEIGVAAIWSNAGFIMLDVTRKNGLWSSCDP
jgi:hypothetical protein